MNTQQYRNTLLDTDWVEVIEEHIATYPTALAIVVEPGLCGQYDAEQGNVCQPYERGYRKLADCEAYIVSYRASIEAWAKTVQEINNTLDYEDDILDREWHSRGMW